ncbi:FUSC family protein [Dactylosporangium sp. AC04546]|uniref:FUSC family protein n=1 Tax=Dactylosporangium sp. AC04546 TaxID=2862460 RepID=UPI001EDF5D36|nr:FUSC family protein [Dactylosporangium sp. AC04546]WVK87805.1 FUSC family protein [Dactylosporangium sp. AC04546]
MRSIFPATTGPRARRAAVGLLPVVATVATLAPFASLGVVVLGAAVALMGGRSPHTDARRLLLVPAGSLTVAVFAVLFGASHLAGDCFFVLAVALATAARALGRAAATVGRALVLPLIGMLIAPVAPGAHPLRTLLWATLAVLVADAYVLTVGLMVRRDRPVRQEPAAGVPARVHLARGVQAGVALAAAFLVGQSVFGDHWAWTVISAYTVGAAARSRGDAILKGIHRTVGAVGGTVAATLLAGAVGANRTLTVGLLLAVLAAGAVLRDYGYAWWAASVTAALALLYQLLGVADPHALLAGRLAAVVAGALCAVLPAALLVPVRTGAVVRKRAAEALRAIKGNDPGLAAERVGALREAAKPLQAVRRWHVRPELAWVDALTAVLPDLRRAEVTDAARHAAAEVGRSLRATGGDRAGQERPRPA